MTEKDAANQVEKQRAEVAMAKHQEWSALQGQLPYFHNACANYNLLMGTPENPGLMAKRDMNIDADWRLLGENGEKQDRPDRGPAFLIGSGPSLDEAMPYLNELRQNHPNSIIMCAGSQFWSLIATGVVPDYVLVHDPYHINSKYISATAYAEGIKHWPKGLVDKTVMVTHPAASKQCMTWPTFAYTGQLYIEQVVIYREFFHRPELVTCTGYEGIEQSVLCGYSDIPTTDWFDHDRFGLRHSVIMGPNSTLQASMLAGWLGYFPLYFVGYDLCHWKNRLRFKTIYCDGTESTIPQIPKNEQVIQPEGSPFPTQTDMELGKRTAIRYAWEFLAPFVEVVVDGTPGALEIFPRISVEELAKGGKRNVHMAEIRAKAIDVSVERGWLDPEKFVNRFGWEALPEVTKEKIAKRVTEELRKNEKRVVTPTDSDVNRFSKQGGAE